MTPTGTAAGRMDDLSGRVRRQAATLADVRGRAGAAGVAYLLAQRILVGWGHVDWFWFWQAPIGPPGPDDLPFRWATPEDAELLCGFGADPQLVRRRLADGDACALLEGDGGLGAYVWYVVSRPYDENGLLFQLATGDVWAYDAEVSPALRGRRMFPRLLDASKARLHERGARRAVWTVDRLNEPSLRSSERLGARFASVLKVRLGPLAVVRVERRGGPARWRLYRRRLKLPIP